MSIPARPNPSSSPAFWSALSLSLLAATLALSRLQPVYWADVWWHLGTGEYIWRQGRIPLVDVFSWTMKGAL